MFYVIFNLIILFYLERRKRIKKKLLTYLSYFSLMSYALSLSVFGPLLQDVAFNLRIEESEIGLLFAFQFTGFISSVLVSGYCVDKWGIKFMSIAGQSFLCLSLFLFFKSDFYLLALISLFFMGLAGGIIEISTNSLISYLYSQTRGASLNLLHIFFGIGGVMGPLYSGYLISNNFNWHLVYLSLFIFSAVILLGYLFLKFPSAISRDKINLIKFKQIIKSKFTILIGLVILIYAGCEMSINNWGVLYLERTLKMEKLKASSFITYFWFSMTIGRIFCVAIAKRIREEKLLFILSLISTIFFFSFLFSPHSLGAGISLALVGFFFSGIFALIIALGSNKFPQALGTINGIIMVFCGIGLISLPWFTGIIVEILSIKFAFSLLGILLILLTRIAYKITHKP